MAMFTRLVAATNQACSGERKLKQLYRTDSRALLKKINLSIVLNRRWTNAPLSRVQLTNVTGLEKTTNCSLVQEMPTNYTLVT
jgi:hypothetical protein